MKVDTHNSNPRNCYRLSSIVIDLNRQVLKEDALKFSDLPCIQSTCQADYGCDVDRVCCERVPRVWVYCIHYDEVSPHSSRSIGELG